MYVKLALPTLTDDTVLLGVERPLELGIINGFLFYIGPVALEVLTALALSGEAAVAWPNRAFNGLAVNFLVGVNLFYELPLFCYKGYIAGRLGDAVGRTGFDT